MSTTQSPKMPIVHDFFLDRSLMSRRMGDFGFRRGTRCEIDSAMALGEELVGQKLASPEAIAALDELTEVTAWVTGHPVEGLLLQYPLSPAGELAVRDGIFAPKQPAREHISAPGKVCSAIYCAIYAGKTHQARKNIMMACATLRFEIAPEIPTFARAATEDGARSMLSLGMHAVEGGLPDLFVQEAISGPRVEAA